MTTLRLLSVLSGAALALGACSGGGGGGTGGSGGNGGGGGTTGMLCSNAPPCVAALYNLALTCPATGACTTATQNADNIIVTCFANGVKVFTDYTHATIRQTKPDGTTTCVVETYATNPSAVGSLDLTFKDANGTTIATATTNSAGQVFTCDGQTYDIAVECPSFMGGSEPLCTLSNTCQ